LLKPGRWNPLRPKRSPRCEAKGGPRLEKLAAKARAIILFEQAWRLMVPPFVVAGIFVSVSWTGLWLDVPYWARGLGILVLVLGLAVALLPLRKFRWPSRKDALNRIDKVSGLVSRPATVLDDKLGNGGDDPATLAMWDLHRRRARETIALLRAGEPSPRAADIDRYALRAAVLVTLVATGFIAGHEKYARLAAAFDWRFDALHGKDSRIDVWIDPPVYTGRPPLVLNLGGSQNFAGKESSQQVEAPVRSAIVIHAPGGNLDLDMKGAIAEAAKDQNSGAHINPGGAAKPASSDRQRISEARLDLRGDATLTLGSSGKHLGTFDIHAAMDAPPWIALTGAPRFNLRGTFALNYTVTDDYGVTAAEANFAKPILPGGHSSKRSLVDPPRVPLVLPPPNSSGEAETTADLSDHPWAGAQVEMTLTARDDAGNEGVSDRIEIPLPQKPFVNPLARALAEQRRNLVLAPDDKVQVANALDALMIAPETFGTGAGVYLGLRVALDQLNAARRDSELVEVADYLWQMALRIESGDLSEAERELRAAEKDLRDALKRGAPEEEIDKLAENLRAAMEKFLQELASKQNDGDHQNDTAAHVGRGRWITPKQLQSMLDQLQEMLRSGDTASAQKLLEQLQDIFENLRVARPHKADPRAREMSGVLDELGRLSQDQQDLRDETYQSGQAERHRQRGERGELGFPGQLTLGDIFGQNDNEGSLQDGLDKWEYDQGKSDKSPRTGQTNDADLANRQQALRDRLENLRKRLDEAEAGANGLNGAQGAMHDAEKGLRQVPGGIDGAVEAQGRAVEALREGAQQLAESMRGEGEGSGEGEEQDGGQGQFGAADGTDPLGRPSGHDRGVNNPAAGFDPVGVPAAERARRVLEELRRRLGEPARPREERDYLERLLRRY
jgi:uncharacterized protein (TIGR02302 family)